MWKIKLKEHAASSYGGLLFYVAQKGFLVKAGTFIFTVKSRLSYRESHQDKLGIGQNDVPEFDGNDFQTIEILFQNFRRLLPPKVSFSQDLND